MTLRARALSALALLLLGLAILCDWLPMIEAPAAETVPVERTRIEAQVAAVRALWARYCP